MMMDPVLCVYFAILLLIAMVLGLSLSPIILLVVSLLVIFFVRNGSRLGGYNTHLGRATNKLAALCIYFAVVFMWIAHGIGWLKVFIGGFIG